MSEFLSMNYRRSASPDVHSSEYLEVNRNRSGNGLFLNYMKRFCESCQMSKPKGRRKAKKGWRCDDCLSGRKP